jgi:hypothetical protein
MSVKVVTKLIVYGDGRTEGEYYITDNPDVLIKFTPVFTQLVDGFAIREMSPEAVKVMYDQCAYGL